MAGVIITSAERRLKGNNSDGDTDTVNTVKKIMNGIINMAAEGNRLENLRHESDNIELFETFVSICLTHFTASYNWRYNASSLAISKIFTSSDEALCILLLENNAADYVVMNREQRKINRKEAKPKWTKVECADKKFRGWDRRGIRRFNFIVNTIQRNRQSTVSLDMEEKLKVKYTRLANDGIEQNNTETDSDDDDLDELNGYDGFGGDIELDRITDTDGSHPLELEGVTNQIAV
mgnify:FL=1